MKKWVLILFLPLTIVTCGKKKENSNDILNNLGLFAIAPGQVTQRFSIKGLWESDRIYSANNDYTIQRVDIRSHTVTSSTNCFYDGENLYATTSSPAEETQLGVIMILENNSKKVESTTGRECIAYASKGRISDNRIRPDGTFGDVGGTFRKIKD